MLIRLSLNVNFNESLTNDIVSFEQLGPDQWILLLISMPENLFPDEAVHLQDGVNSHILRMLEGTLQLLPPKLHPPHPPT